MPPKLVTVVVKPGSVVRKDGRAFHCGHEVACTPAEAASFYLSGAAYLPDNVEDVARVRRLVHQARTAEARHAEPPRTPESIEDPRDFRRVFDCEPLAEVAARIAPPPPRRVVAPVTPPS